MKKMILASLLVTGFAYAGENAHKCNANRCGGDQSKILINGNKDVKKPVKKETKNKDASHKNEAKK